MFKLPGTIPTSRANVEEVTDYIESECIKSGDVLFRNVMRQINFINDEIDVGGIQDEGDDSNDKLDEIQIEINRRITASKNRYPFEPSGSGYSMRVKQKDLSYWVYTYLLLSTRLNMIVHGTWNGIDGTALLEKLSAIVAKEYFGERADSMVFGTAVTGGFEAKINDLCSKIGEGHSLQIHIKRTKHQKDDKLDVVAWKSFSDDAHSKLIGFGQCKTGTSWDDKETIELQPEVFCRKWLIVQPVVTPVKMFFCSQYFPVTAYDKVVNAGIVFDRLRILDYLPNVIDSALETEVKSWCEGALTGLASIQVKPKPKPKHKPDPKHRK